MVEEIEHYEHTLLTGKPRQQETIDIRWKHPHKNWINLNCDGVYKNSMDVTSYGGLFWDLDGRCL